MMDLRRPLSNTFFDPLSSGLLQRHRLVIHRQSVPLVFFKAENLEYSEIICIFDLKMRSKIGCIWRCRPLSRLGQICKHNGTHCSIGSKKSNLICFFARFALSLPVVTTNHVMHWRSIVDEMEGPKIRNRCYSLL